MDDAYANPRDVETDQAEITSRLGEPEASYRTNPGSVAWRFALGVLIVLLAAGLHYLMWSGTLPWPRGHVKLWIVLIAAMFVGPGVGLYLISFAVRGMKMWVLAYPTGLFVWHRGHVVAFAWDDIRAVQVSGVPAKAELRRTSDNDQLPNAVWFDLARSGRRVLGTSLTLTRGDGEQVVLSSILGDFPELGRRVQQETFRRLFPRSWSDLREGLPLSFGQIACDARGIVVGNQKLTWSSLESLARNADKIEIRRSGKKKAWAKCDLAEVINPHVLTAIVDAVRSQGPTA